MKQFILFLIFILLVSWLPGCATAETADIAATTLPVYEFTLRLCDGTGLTVARLVTENVSCLHDYTLKVDQMRAIQGAKAVVISGAGLEDFMEDALSKADHIIDASKGLDLLDGHHNDHEHSPHGHIHEEDPHIWLSPANGKRMAHNICHQLSQLYPDYATMFDANLKTLEAELDALQAYGEEKLSDLSCREMITFHDGFSYLAESFHLTILEAVEEEAGSEASAAKLIHLTNLLREHQLPAIFIEINGSVSAADIISAETGLPVYSLDMCMSGNSYFTAMKYNIDTIWEAMR